jgi:alkylhydroperoxidase family enzyme
MSHFTYADSPYPVRRGLKDAHRNYWGALAGPGTWFSGAQRVAIAAEVRSALTCPFCAERKVALSPSAVTGEHQSDTALEPRMVDAVHRVITDQSRITQAFIDDIASAGFTEEQYVELVGIAVTVLSIDEFNRALGIPLEPLPVPQGGEPSHYRPGQAQRGTGFVAMIPADGATGEESDLWPRGRTANVLRALSLVPNAVREWMAVGAEQYLSMRGMARFSEIPGRSINRMQIELVAGRVSSHNECFY